MRFHSKFIPLAAALLVVISNAFAVPEFLPPEKAFQAEATWVTNTNDVEMEIFPAKAYYISQ